MKVTVIEIDQSIIDKVDIELFGSLEAAKKAKLEMDKLWCKCKVQDNGAYHVPDNVHPECDKHHWRCTKCKKIVQIG